MKILSGLKRCLCAAALFSLVVPASHAGVLGTLHWSAGFAEKGSLPPQLWLRFSMASDPSWPCWTNSPSSCYEIWSGTLTGADTGSTFAITAANNPDFGQIAALLTNGVSNWLAFSGRVSGPVADPGGAIAYHESDLVTGGAADFAGSPIGEIDLTVTSLAVSPIMLPTQEGVQIFTMANATVDVSVLSDPNPTPEPASLVSTAFGLIAAGGLLALKRRYRSR